MVSIVNWFFSGNRNKTHTHTVLKDSPIHFAKWIKSILDLNLEFNCLVKQSIIYNFL